MKKHVIAGVVLCLVLGICGYVVATAWGDDAAGGMEKKAVQAQALYVCPDCHTVAMMAGKCPKCQKDMQAMHVLGVKDGKAMLCSCGADCKCDEAGIKDGKCSCGKDVVTVSLKGMYVCACGGGKCCATISDKPGKCACGADMKKVE